MITCSIPFLAACGTATKTGCQREIPDGSLDRSVEDRQVKFLVGGVDVVVGQTETHENRWNSEHILKCVDDRDGTTGANKDGWYSEAFLISMPCGLNGGVLSVDEGRLDG
jgi:hypothetical protein